MEKRCKIKTKTSKQKKYKICGKRALLWRKHTYRLIDNTSKQAYACARPSEHIQPILTTTKTTPPLPVNIQPKIECPTQFCPN